MLIEQSRRMKGAPGIYDARRDQSDEKNRSMEQLRADIGDGSIDSILDNLRGFVLDPLKTEGFCRRCPCLLDVVVDLVDRSCPRQPRRRLMTPVTWLCHHATSFRGARGTHWR